ncbi:hypothetical protein B0H19DRAFT_1072982 [Mycena capillaripes]|nr:hypothetical protein B0H19DRAFT_1072982 [Mycena capillaripes]
MKLLRDLLKQTAVNDGYVETVALAEHVMPIALSSGLVYDQDIVRIVVVIHARRMSLDGIEEAHNGSAMFLGPAGGFNGTEETGFCNGELRPGNLAGVPLGVPSKSQLADSLSIDKRRILRCTGNNEAADGLKRGRSIVGSRVRRVAAIGVGG